MAEDKIVIADDDVPFCEALCLRLQREGYKTFTVHEGIRVLETVLREKPGLVILDLKMPVGPGSEVLKNLKKNPQVSKIPVIVITGTYLTAEKETLELGAAAFFRKPYDPEELFAKIGELILHCE